MTEQRLIGRPRSTAPVPSDFTRHARVEGDLKLRARYSVGRPVILRWRAETGIYCGAKRQPSRGSAKPLTTQAKRARQRYTPPPMHEISWYDGEDDLSALIGDVGRFAD
jgi:hypothetical protein